MVIMIDDEELYVFIVKVYEVGKVVSIVCYGMLILFKMWFLNGDFFVKGKIWMGFVDVEE